MKNYFEPKSAAQRYAKGRPYFHAEVIQRIRERLTLDQPVPWAVDVGCGTGLSSVPLRQLARHVLGVDVSREMVALAPAQAGTAYLVARAERLPLGTATIDLMTLSSAFHWLERGSFFVDAWRVLRPNAWLIIYDHYFAGQMVENPAFQAWNWNVLLAQYPTPPRAPSAFDSEELEREGFHLVAQEQFQNSIRFTAGGLVNYLLTQTNVIAAIEGGRQSIGDARRWLTDGVTPFFQSRREATFLFQGPLWCLRRSSERRERG